MRGTVDCWRGCDHVNEVIALASVDVGALMKNKNPMKTSKSHEDVTEHKGEKKKKRRRGKSRIP